MWWDLHLRHFGVGFGNFFGGSISQAGWRCRTDFRSDNGGCIPRHYSGDSQRIPVIGTLFFSYGFLTYLSVIVAVVMTYFLNENKKRTELRAVGESPATADAAGINVSNINMLPQ